ncbi:MAG: hypothetical protein E6703_00915 [Finegoldia magna]|nr:hypothetical protein [Finegoldia magna]
MYYGIDKNKLNLSKAKEVIETVEELQKSLEDEGYDFTFDQVLKIYAFSEINGNLEDIVPVD